MADPLSVASGVAGIVSLTIQAIQLSCKYIAEVSHAGETALQCLRSLSMLRDVLERYQETQEDEKLASIVNRKSELVSPEHFEACRQSVDKIHQKLQTLFNADGTIKRRNSLMWPFKSSESAALIKQLQDFRDTFAAILTADSLDVSVKIHDIVTDTHNSVDAVKTNIESSLEAQRAAEVLEWILPEQSAQWRFGSDTTGSVGDRAWFFDSPAFNDWLGSDGGIFWCHGPPGSGKSVLMSQTIHRLQQSTTDPSVVLSHFCNHRDSKSQTPDVLFRHLIYQAALQSDSVLQDVLACSEYQDAKLKKRRCRLAEIQRILLDVCILNRRLVLIVDGADECSEEVDGSEARSKVLQVLKLAASKGARVLVASRRLPDIDEALGDCFYAAVRAEESELRAHVSGRFDAIEKRITQANRLRDSVVDKVVKEADGLFLLARLMMDMLSPSNVKNLRQIKNFLSQERSDLSGLYRTTLDRILSSDRASADLALRVLTWVCYAQRPLRKGELQHAVTTELGDDDFEPDGITPYDLIEASCMGLLACDTNDTISLFHLTAYEFLRSTPEISSATAQILLSRTCLTYMSFSQLEQEGSCKELGAYEARAQEYCFLDYAAKHWSDHARQIEDQIVDDIMSIITNDVLRALLGQVFYYRDRTDHELRKTCFESLPTGSFPLQVACSRGLLLTAKKLLLDGADVEQADNQGWTSLIAAASYNRLELVKLLIQHADTTRKDGQKPRVIDQCDKASWTALIWAIVKGHYDIVGCLLAAKADSFAEHRDRWRPIDWAIFCGNSEIIKLLLDHNRGAPSSFVQTQWVRFETNLFYRPAQFSSVFLAVSNGSRESVETLLGHEARVMMSEDGAEGFQLAAKGMQRLITKLERPYVSGSYCTHPSMAVTVKSSVKLLEAAIRSHHMPTVKILVELGMSLGPLEAEAKRRTPLHIAACCGNTEACEYFLSNGAVVSSQDADGNSPLDLAFRSGQLSCIRALTPFLTEPNKINSRFLVVFASRPWGTDFDDFVDDMPDHDCRNDLPLLEHTYLVELGFSKQPKDSALHSCKQPKTKQRSSNGSFDEVATVLNDLLRQGWDINSSRKDAMTVLHHACVEQGNRSLDLLKFLLASGADVHLKNRTGKTPLHLLCQDNFYVTDFDSSKQKVVLEILETLIDHGAHVDAVDYAGRKPMHYACFFHNIDFLCCLIDHGAHIETEIQPSEHDPPTALTNTGEASVVIKEERILSDFSDEDSEPNYRSKRHAPIYYAIKGNNWAAVDLLRKHGAKLPESAHLTKILWDRIGCTDWQNTRRLLDLGALPISQAKEYPLIPRYISEVWHSITEEVFEQRLEELIGAGADINALYVNGWDKSKKSALRIAHDRNFDDALIRILVKHGAVATQEAAGKDLGES